MNYILFFGLMMASVVVKASDTTKPNLYHPEANATKDISDAIAKAKAENKHVLIQAGGNWCTWCIRLHNYMTLDKQIDSILKKDYVVYHLNYSPENKNAEVFAKYEFPERFGFPVFLILDGTGKKIHTQNTVYFEAVKSYDRDKIFEFLQQWTPAAVHPKSYNKKS